MDWKRESEMFNQMADYYDKYRPSYPTETINTIISKAGLTSESKLLEIGAGSGKATGQFVDRVFEIVCIEPGADLAKKGSERFAGKNVTYVVSRFEDYSAPHEYFDAVISAQAFHWVPQPVGYKKCADTLKPGGYIALFWNMDIIRERDIDRELLAITDKYGAVSCMHEGDYAKRMETISSGINESCLFSAPEIIHVHWDKDFTAEEYYGYLLTSNAFVQKTKNEQKLCFEELTQLASKHGGLIQRQYTCELYFAKKI